ncbi:hypothetical protein GGI04_001156 [Coemansia thaxteri]|nr:hypothetical protein GGI04_001156 [Coemansia thaxteri]KAJ2479935.1 hypothetical protein EV174_003873 [Coemansia sp. RSA 2320]
MSDPALQGALNPSAPPVSGVKTYSVISGICGQLSRAAKSPLREVVGSLIAAGKLTRLFTDDAHTVLLTPDSRNKDAVKIESRLITIRGSVTKYTCLGCTAQIQLTQAVLFKVMSDRDIMCEMCGTRGHMAASASDDNGEFVPEIFNARDNAQSARKLAQADAQSQLDLLLVVGATADVSREWISIASVLSSAAAKTVVLDCDMFVPPGMQAGSGALDVIPVSVEQFVQRWKDTQTLVNESPIHGGNDNTAPINSAPAEDNGDQVVLDGVSELSLADASSATESAEDMLCSQSCASPSASEFTQAKRGTKGAKGRSRDKTSLNHLLNFSLPVRMPPPLPAVRPRRPAAENVVSERQAEQSRATFVNANFRFVLKPVFWSSFMSIATRADLQLEWKWIERVIMPVTGEVVTCPICLSPPVAPRVTKCGHVICYPCALRYLSFECEGGLQPKKCPICWAMVSGNDLLPVHLWEAQYRTSAASRGDLQQTASRLAPGAHITMRLMKRPHKMTICLPRTALSRICTSEAAEHANREAAGAADKYPPLESHHFPWTFTEGALPFAKFILASYGYIQEQLSQELDELVRARAEEDDDPFAQMYIESAIMNVEELLKTAQSPSAGDKRLETRALTEQGYSENSSNGLADGDPGAASNESEQNPEQFYYFYQSDDGQHIYMHPLDIRVLAQEHGGFVHLPDTISLKVKHAVESTITDEVRRRFRFLQHLSLRCDVVFIEPDLKGLASRDSIEKYRSQLLHRDQQHAARARHAAFDQARSELIAEAAARVASAEMHSIQYRSEWSRDGHGRYDDAALASFNGAIPDESSFPALSESRTAAEPEPVPASNTAVPRSAATHSQHSRPLWPRQPPSGAPSGSGAGSAYDEFWDDFERAVAATSSKDSHHDYDDEAGSLADYENAYEPDFSVLAKGADSRLSQAGFSAAGKSRKSKKGLTLVLSGSNSHRRR